MSQFLTDEDRRCRIAKKLPKWGARSANLKPVPCEGSRQTVQGQTALPTTKMPSGRSRAIGQERWWKTQIKVNSQPHDQMNQPVISLIPKRHTFITDLLNLAVSWLCILWYNGTCLAQFLGANIRKHPRSFTNVGPFFFCATFSFRIRGMQTSVSCA